MIKRQLSPLGKYCSTILIIGIAFFLKWVSEPYITYGSHVLFSGAILVVSFYCGLGPGILATFLSAPLSGYFWILRHAPIRATEIQVVIYFIEGIVVSVLTSEFAKSKAKIQSLILDLRLKNEQKERFFSALSHDLKTPLTAIKLKVQGMIRKNNSEPASSSTLLQIVKSVDRADRMINDLLDADRINSGHAISLHLEPTDLKSILRETVEDFEPGVEERVVLELTEEKVEGLVDPVGLRRVFDNLLTNAVKYSPPSTPIFISLKTIATAFTVTIRNYGPAIPSEEKELLFEPFYRSKSVENKIRSSGWGIGLAVVNSIVKAHNGSVEVESDPKFGTTFIVLIPSKT